MFEATDMTMKLDDGETGAADAAPVRATSFTCPHCTFVNWCTFDAGHSGDCHCDHNHYWPGNH